MSIIGSILESPNLLQTLLVGIIVFLIIYGIVQQFTRPSGMPPGPAGLPFVGCLPFMSEDWHCDLTRMGKGYGDIFSIYLGNELLVIFNGYKASKEALFDKKDIFCGRPFSHGAVQIDVHSDNIQVGDATPKWKERKQFAITALKAYGNAFGKLQTMLDEEAEYTVELLMKYDGKPFMLEEALFISAANPMMRIMMNKRQTVDDNAVNKEFREVTKASEAWFEALGIVLKADVVPLLRFWPGQNKGIKKGKEATKVMKHYLQEVINEHRENFQKGDVAKDFIDYCIDTGMDDDEMILLLFSMWGDGIATTPAALRWLMLWIILNPECQAKVQNEIDDVIGSRRPTLADKPNLHYFEACFAESLRISNLVPLSIAMKSVEETTILGYRIPKGTHLYTNMSNVNHDPTVWDEPDAFKPERFLDENGKFKSKLNGFFPFGAGHRRCAGEHYGRIITYMLGTYLFQRFTFSMPEKENKIDGMTFAVSGVSNAPQDFKVIAKPRIVD